ncbi:MAG: Vitamin dependent methionine synthase activation region [Peptococcaceae bacterium]|jgi:hypothetical protein|nr:Vitamin dependent methionine synthase activation region [Peptococcaceae bacterium]
MNLVQLPLNLSPEEVFPFLGITSGTRLAPELMNLIQHYLQSIKELAKPQGLWQTYGVKDISPERITLEASPLVIAGKKTVPHFDTSVKVSLLAVTLGSRIDNLLAELGRERTAHALILDGVASAAVEGLAEQLDQHISREIRRQGYFPTARFSPGYGDWPLSWQKAFLESIDAKKIELSVTPHFLLQPVKSITAAIGWSHIPVERNYELPARKKPCQGTLSCQNCPLSSVCQKVPNHQLRDL